MQKHRNGRSYSGFVIDERPLVKVAAKSDSSTVTLSCFWFLQDSFPGEAVDTAGSCRAHHFRQEAKCLARLLQTFVTLGANVPSELLRWGFYIYCPIQSILRSAEFASREMKEGFTSEISLKRKEFHSRLCYAVQRACSSPEVHGRERYLVSSAINFPATRGMCLSPSPCMRRRFTLSGPEELEATE